MLDGVTILSTGTYIIPTPGWGVFSISFLILGIAILLFSICGTAITWDITWMAFSVVTLFIFMFCYVIYSLDGPPIEYPKWKVIIDDTVNFNEFTERYQILSQDGLIYEITEKRADSN